MGCYAKKEKPSHIFLRRLVWESKQISVKTLNYSQEGARLLIAQGVPIIFIVGNHDLYLKSERKHILDQHLSRHEELCSGWRTNVFRQRTEAWVSHTVIWNSRKSILDLAASVNAAKYVLGHFEFRGICCDWCLTVLWNTAQMQNISEP